ncbi:hypothetical protein B566_EDAN001836, partial [Ephemera danica]
MIEQAMQEYHDNTCIKFRPYNKTDDQDYVSIEKAEAGCFARSEEHNFQKYVSTGFGYRYDFG